MTNETTYNGWTNYETWNFNLWFDDAFTEEAQEIADRSDDEQSAVDELAEYIESYAGDVLEMPKTGFLGDVAGMALRSVNWREIAEHYIAECDKPESWNENAA